MRIARRHRALVGLALASVAVAACGTTEERPAGGSAATTSSAVDDEASDGSRCVALWNRPGNSANQRRAAGLGEEALAVVFESAFAISGESEAIPTKPRGCLFSVYVPGPDGWPAGSETLALVDGEWYDPDAVWTASPELAGGRVVEARVAGDGTLEQFPPEARSSKVGYAARIGLLMETFGPRAGELFSELVVGDGLSASDCARKAREFHERIQLIVSELGRLQPPEEIEALVREFLAEATVSAEAIGGAATAADRGELPCGMPMNRRIYGLPSTERAERVLDELEERGYVFFGQ